MIRSKHTISIANIGMEEHLLLTFTEGFWRQATDSKPLSKRTARKKPGIFLSASAPPFSVDFGRENR